MAVDYQQILMDMNRPHRRQGNGMKKLFGVVCFMMIVGGGAYAAWETGMAGAIWTKVTSFASGVFGRERVPAATPSVQSVLAQAETVKPADAPAAANAVAMNAPAASLRPAAPAQSLRPQTASAALPIPAETAQSPGSFISAGPVAMAAPAMNSLELAKANDKPVAMAAKNTAPLDVAAIASSTSEFSHPPARSVSAAQAQMQLQAEALQRQSQKEAAQASQAAFQTRPAGGPPSEAPVARAATNIAPTPVLSDARAQIKVVDQMLASNPAEALRRIEELMASRLEPDDAAEAGYRRGYAARMLRDENKAETSWRETSEKYPNLRGGRFSALALADTWFHRYAGERPQMSYWDDIQLLYSRALGADDAPFLPDNVKTAVKTKLNRLNDSLFFGSAPSKLARYHKVENGELLGTIASKYRVDYESIARINGINPNRIHAGMDLKLMVGDVDIVVRKNERDPNRGPTLTWFLDGRWIREYPACVGDGLKTPAGTYTLTSKERQPSWTNPANGQLLPNDHPENILGSRWMAMKGMNTQGLGIHGTTINDSIPGYTSAGCIRLLNKDVEELFSFSRISGRVTVID